MDQRVYTLRIKFWGSFQGKLTRSVPTVAEVKLSPDGNGRSVKPCLEA